MCGRYVDEWRASPRGKEPSYVSSSDVQPLAMAGLFEAWGPDESSEWSLTCCVVSTEPNALMAPIHDRMPVMLAEPDWAAWLGLIAPLPAPLPSPPV